MQVVVVCIGVLEKVPVSLERIGAMSTTLLMTEMCWLPYSFLKICLDSTIVH